MNIIIQHEIELHQYAVRQSKSKVASLLHPEFSEVGKSGMSYDYKSIIERMENEKPSNGYTHSQDYETIQLGASARLLLYKSAFVDESGKVTGYCKRSSIWLFNGVKWQMKYHQGTPCSPFELID